MSDQETPGHSVNESRSVGGADVPPSELHTDSLPSIIIPELSAKKHPAS